MLPRYMPALVTPFSEDETIDRDAHVSNVAAAVRNGMEGMVIGGSSGQGTYLDPGERRTLTADARSAAPDSYLVTGVAAESVRQASAMADEAAAGGADAVLVYTPTTLIRHLSGAMERFFTLLANESALPVILYSVPKVTAYELPMKSAIALADHPNVAGIKDSGGDPARARTIAAETGGGFAVFAGASAAVAPAVAGGAHGAITASGNYAWELVSSLAVRPAGDGAEERHLRLTRLTGVVESFGMPGVGYAAARRGLRPGSPRRPLRPLTSEEAAVVDAAMDEAEL